MGVRIYPRTPLERLVKAEGPMAANPNLHGRKEDNDSFLHPVFYIDHRLGDRPVDLLLNIIGGDQRFFPPPREQDATNYNYHGNQVLEKAIQAGHRGAYWDILRQLAPGGGPA